jgi:tetratricopeptide (TPR) repeat protein
MNIPSSSTKGGPLSQRVQRYRREVQALVRQGIEHPQYELKREISIGRDKLGQRLEFVKQVQGMANSHLCEERFLVIGADQKKRDFVPVSNVAEFDPARVSELLNKYLQPPPSLEVFNSLQNDEGCPFVLIVLSSVQPRPIAVKTEGAYEGKVQLREGDVWIKTDTRLHLATPDDLAQMYGAQIKKGKRKRWFGIGAITLAILVALGLGALLRFPNRRHEAGGPTGPNQEIQVGPRSKTMRASYFLTDAEAAEPPSNLRESLPLSPEANNDYLAGWEAMKRQDYLGAKRNFEKAVATQPKNALAHIGLAAALAGLGDDFQARQEADTARNLTGSLSVDQRLWITGWSHEVRNEWQEAIENFRLLWKQPQANYDYGLRLVRAQIKAGNAAEALHTIDEIRKKPGAGDDPRVDLAEADVRESLSEFQQELSTAKLAESKARKLATDKLVAQALMSQGVAFWNLGQITEAKNALGNAKGMFLRNQDAVGADDALMIAVDIAYEQGEEVEAEKYYKELLESYRSIGNELGFAKALQRLGSVLADRNDVTHARPMFEESIRIETQMGAKENLASTEIGFGGLLEGAGDLSAAMAEYQKSLKLSKDTGDLSGQMSALANIGDVHYEKGDLNTARTQYEDALAICKKIGDKGTEADLLWKIGDVLFQRDDLVRAKQNYYESISLGTNTHEILSAAIGRASLAQALIQEGKLENAEALGRQAAKEFHGAGDPSDEALAWATIAESLIAQNKVLEAKSAIDNMMPLLPLLGVADRLGVQIVAARARAASDGVQDGLTSLQMTISEAHDRGLYRLELEARLAHGEIEVSSGEKSRGNTYLIALEKEARAKGYTLVARNAKSARK